jgi:hypothetical protein
MADRAGAKSWWLRASVMAGSAAWATAIIGCTGTPAPPMAWLEASIGASAVPDTSCMNSSTLVFYSVESDGGTSATTLPTVSNGETVGGATVSVSCNVSQSGSGFTVSAKTETGQIGNFSLQGTSPWTASTPPTGVNISFGYNGFAYSESDCTVTYANAAQTNLPIAGGRVWGSFNCPMMMASPAGQASNVCLGTGMFQFSNCTGD